MFSLDPETGNFSICKVLVPAVLDSDGFFAEAEGFVNVLHAWADIIRNFRPEAAGDDGSHRFYAPGFLSV